MEIRTKNVGEIVSENFATAKIFKKHGIDFCCGGKTPFEQACRNAGANPDVVKGEIENISLESKESIPFASWPVDLLIDYVLKIHHRNIRKRGPEILDLIKKVIKAHGENHGELFEIHDLFEDSLYELESHLQKEEEILFPYLLELFMASEQNRMIEPMHCGTIANPISVMESEHENEGERYHKITEISNNFKVPEDGCSTYRLMLEELSEFMNALFEHIHIENNILFPKTVDLEQKHVAGF